ncbi:tRNA intron endonuclease, catalytic domain protein [Sulfolobus islandicus Y.G.57.14]|uniref:tRNA intron endonuclease, catalytic domain protein n=9 Tax=Saccharolobus islandicus TaxID=43080 RepID=C3MRE3_SACI2|nr:tRNA-splicing endonuclease [Sulfolobus islandicus]ACP35956.1 tRNA intron endonuclease, catalytic domain protein [Sulfolobus islandicus L.S.2.15]ACP38596.1 tRNA intron endonuclease, catalytic domain protein [Sulfolobus islandicus M.14.25]ACP46194.1 tRNA intron endonuclease, catalytic domain protein [Sulfolobus islandicus Y.G.57.14]ACP55810.1 tRNA intron endonuclease, catalytic domain protein [Sulfolobus islandicus M.16.27]ACR42472.1 tRNA intron endonuclease, catalytic domain protein [Sulfolo
MKTITFMGNILIFDNVTIMSEKAETTLEKIYLALSSSKQLPSEIIYLVNWDKVDVFVDLKQRGRVTIDGIDEQSLIIKDKENGKYTAMVLIVDENEKVSFKKILDKLHQSKSMNLELYLSIVDKYGDVTYYTISEIKMSK